MWEQTLCLLIASHNQFKDHNSTRSWSDNFGRPRQHTYLGCWYWSQKKITFRPFKPDLNTSKDHKPNQGIVQLCFHQRERGQEQGNTWPGQNIVFDDSITKSRQSPRFNKIVVTQFFWTKTAHMLVAGTEARTRLHSDHSSKIWTHLKTAITNQGIVHLCFHQREQGQEQGNTD